MPDHDYILESLRQAVPMLRNLAYTYELDFDDLYQDCFLVALDCYDQAMHYKNPRGFIHARFRWHALMQVRARSYCPSVPLDAIGELSVKSPVAGPPPEKREQALFAALQRLTIQQQCALTTFFGLAAYEPVANGRRSWRATAPNKSAAWERRKKGLAELRRDQALREAVQ